MRVGILGPLRVVVDGTTGSETTAGDTAADIGGARLRALLIRLALDTGRTVSAEALAQALWSDSEPADRVHALQSLVSRLRRALPGGIPIRSVHGGYRLDLSPDAVDALLFERLAREGKRALTDGDAASAVRLLQEALDLWRGEALADAAQAPYAVAAAARLEELRLAATEDRVAAELEVGGEMPPLIAELERLTAAHPLRERLRRLQLEALHADGRQAEALTAYERYRRVLADELGTDPGQELQDAHLVVLRDEAPRQRRDGPRSNLPAPLTSFVGRDEERRQVRTELREGRLVTLVGPGGAGKTRLATTVAAGMTGEVPGGVWLVELAPITDPDGVAQAVVSALGLREGGGLDGSSRPREPVDRLVEALSVAETLIVLDNCEHLLETAARLAGDLLARCPRLRILATSREPFGIIGEALRPVAPLGLPERTASATSAGDAPAVRLFADRAAAVSPGFTLTDGNIASVTGICRRLDGLPLAIELAAARLRSMSLEQLDGRLDDRFHLLGGGARTALPRHRTLRAVVAWSWDLLEDGERAGAERLSVFSASFSPEAAGWLGIPPAILDALVDKSLIQLTDGPGPRYRMLETIREYGLERLAEAGEIARVRKAHAECFLDLAERAAPQLRGFGQLPWARALGAERDNLLTALHFARDTGDADTAVRLGAALWYFWTLQGEHAEATDRLRTVLELTGEAPAAARIAASAGYLLNSVLSADSGTPRAQARQFRTLVREHGSGDPMAAVVEGLLALITDDPAAGLSVTEERLSHPDPWTRAMLWFTRSLLHGSHGDMVRMGENWTAAAAAFRAAGERWGLSASLTYLGIVRTTLGDFEAAAAALTEAIGLAREFGTDDYPRVWLAMLRKHTGEIDTARSELLDVVTSTTSARYAPLARLSLADLARYDADLEEADRQLGKAWDAFRHGVLDDAGFRALFALGSGNLAVARSELDASVPQLAEALRLAVEMPDMPLAAMVGVGIAQLRLEQGDASGAARVLGASHALRGVPDAFNPDVVRVTRGLRAALGEHAYEFAYSHGRGLERTDALAVLQAGVGHSQAGTGTGVRAVSDL